MSAALKVIQAGLSTTVQDLGRAGAQCRGVPVSGAADPTALRAANVLVGNPQGAAGLEVVLAGPTLEAVAGSVRIAVAGGRTEVSIVRRGGGEPERVPPLQSVRLQSGDRLRIAAVSGSAVAYLAVEGGLALLPFMGSLSTYVRGGFGGFEGRALREGDLLPLQLAAAPERHEVRLRSLDLTPTETIRVVPGPQDDYFTAGATEAFFSQPYTVTREADRMGLRLDGPVLAHSKGFDIVSDGIAPGAVQVPGSGLPIILLADRQTTGGYPKIATVASVDLPSLGRVSPGMRLRFVAVTVETAQALRRAHEAAMQALPQTLEPVRPTGPDPARLYVENLVGGVVDAICPQLP